MSRRKRMVAKHVSTEKRNGKLIKRYNLYVGQSLFGMYLTQTRADDMMAAWNGYYKGSK